MKRKKDIGVQFTPDTESIMYALEMNNKQCHEANVSQTLDREAQMCQLRATTSQSCYRPEISISSALYDENALNGIDLSYLKKILTRHKIDETSDRGQISVRPETQVMAQHNNHTVHHKPPVPTAAPYQYIVLDDLVRRAVQKEWLELDYGAQWWSNDHAPTIYANSKLIPSLSSFLSNRWSELKLILQKRPVAAKKIRLKKSAETTFNQQKDDAQISTQANIEAKYYHQPAATQESFASLPQFSSPGNIPPDTTLSMVHSTPDVKPVPRLDYQNINTNINSSVNQPVNNTLSMPIINGTYDAFPANNSMENIPDINALIPAPNEHLKPKPSYTYLRNLIEGTYEPSQKNFNKDNFKNPFVLSTMPDNSLKLKIKLNRSSQVARSKQHKKKVDEINLKKRTEKAENVGNPKKINKKLSENPKKRKRRVKIKYNGPYKIKKCSVILVPLSDEILRKYTGKGIEHLKKLYKNTTTKKRRPYKKRKTPNLSDNLTITENCTGTDISCSQPSLNAVNSSISSVKTLSDSPIQCSSLPSVPVMKLGNSPASPLRSISIVDSSPVPAYGTTANDLTITPVITDVSSLNKTDNSETKTSFEQVKTTHLSVTEKLDILQSDNLSVTSVKRSLSCDEFISLNKESVKPIEVPKSNIKPTIQEVSECEFNKNSVEKSNEEVETERSELAIKVEANEDNVANLNSEQPVTSDNNISPSSKLEINNKLNGILKRKERALSSSPLRFGKLNCDYVNGKIIPLGQKSSPTTIKRRSSEGSFDVPTISSCISLAATLPTFNNNKETFNKEQEKLLPLISSNKDHETDIDTSMDLNMNYKNNKLLEKPLKNNISLNKNKVKEPNTIFKDTDSGDSTDSNKENPFIEEPIDNIDETTKKHRLDDEQLQEQSPKKLRLEDPRLNRDYISKCNLKIDLSRMELEDNGTEQKEIKQPIMELALVNFDNYSCIHCNGVFMHYKEWKMHYNGHPKCANVTAQTS